MDAFGVETVKTYISKKRVAEMLARGWTIVGPGEEGSLLMEGPDPDGMPQSLESLTRPLVGQAWLRAMEALGQAA
ncbi:MAG TPA: hypothetical protein VD978_30450 [Azospirillum sp.]|nr:hypothetical protein [Azospirillum sp.]